MAISQLQTTVAPAPSRSVLDDMVWIHGRRYVMGSNEHYPEERPALDVDVDGFWMDRHPVTNQRFAEFVEATGHVTVAEQIPDAGDYPGAIPEMLRAGSLVFVQPSGPVPLDNSATWWRYVFGADWRHPLGPDSSIEGLESHPVVHVAYADAEAFATWLGKSVPTEAEWELACRGGLERAAYAWGAELAPGDRMMANYWQGRFPWENLCLDGWERTSPVGWYPPNGFDLHDMIGNVWEWTSDWYLNGHSAPAKTCCTPKNPRGGREQDSYAPVLSTIHIPRKVLKGGSHLCAANYSQRYRPAARQAQPVDSSTSHVGFRCVWRVGGRDGASGA